MKKIIFFVVVVVFGVSVNFAFAQAIPMLGFGGRIITAPTPGVSCPAGALGSPFTMVPAGVAPAGLYVGDYHPTSVSFRLAPGAWVLGLYIPIPIPECATQSIPPAPVAGFRTFIHGTNLGI